MAAITPYLEDPTDEVDLPTPTPLAGLGDEGGSGAVGTAGDALAYAHAEQTRFVWARRLVEKELLTKKFWLEVESRPESANRGEIIMRVSPEFTKDVIPWSLYPGPDGSPIRDSFPIWGEASKMACPTFDLPAGSPVTGGACVGATPGQPTVPPEAKDNFLRAKGDGYVLAAACPGRDAQGNPVGWEIPYKEAQTICAWCYATGGNYSYANIAAGQILRYWWIRSLLQQPGGDDEFARIVIESLKRRRFPAGEPGGLLPVRLHSSGDFYSPAYAMAWVKAANLAAKVSPNIVFWAPTRTWAARGWNGAWPKILAGLDTPNLVVRPSGYHIGDAAPEALAIIQKPGWSGALAARGTTSMTREQNARSRGEAEPRADRDCPVYSLTGGKGEQKPGEDKLTCRTARNPLFGQPGQPEYGCRMCWTAPGLTVNYTTH